MKQKTDKERGFELVLADFKGISKDQECFVGAVAEILAVHKDCVEVEVKGIKIKWSRDGLSMRERGL